MLSAKSSPELLPVSGLMVLEPVEDIFAFNFSIQGEVGSYLLNLGSIGCSDPSSIKLFQDHKLLWGGAPSCGGGLWHDRSLMEKSQRECLLWGGEEGRERQNGW